MLASLNEIDPASFYTPSSSVSLTKNSTSYQVNIASEVVRKPSSPLDLNNPVLSPQPGPLVDMLSDHLSEGDLPKNRAPKSNILAASEILAIESLTKMM